MRREIEEQGQMPEDNEITSLLGEMTPLGLEFNIQLNHRLIKTFSDKD